MTQKGTDQTHQTHQTHQTQELSSSMSYEEIAADPILMEWLKQQPGFKEVAKHAEQVIKANPHLHNM